MVCYADHEFKSHSQSNAAPLFLFREEDAAMASELSFHTVAVARVRVLLVRSTDDGVPSSEFSPSFSTHKKMIQ